MGKVKSITSLAILALTAFICINGCSPQKRIEVAKSKVYNLNNRFPSISKIDTVKLKARGMSKGKVYNVGNGYKIPDWVLNKLSSKKEKPDQPKVSAKPVVGSEDKFNYTIECPPQVCEIEYRYLDRTIVGECDCNYEVNQATKQLKKDRFWLLLSTILGFTLSGVFAFAWVRKS